MASRKIARDLFLSSRHQFLSQRILYLSRLQLVTHNEHSLFRREFGVLNEFSKKIKGEIDRNQELKKTINEIKEEADKLKEVKEDLKARTKQTTEKLYKHVDGVWTEAESKAKKVYADVEEKISAAKEEVKDGFGIGKQEAATGSKGSSNTNGKDDANKSSSFSEGGKQEQQHQQSESTTNNSETLFGKVKFVGASFQKLKDAAKPIEFVKKGYNIVKEELQGNPNRRKHLEYDASSPSADPSPNIERSTRTDVVLLPSKQSPWSKKWEAFKSKVRGHPVYKRVTGYSEPIRVKSQEFAEDVREFVETSDNPVVHKIQDISAGFGESDTAMAFKEIRHRDPTFSLPEFVSEVQEVVKPVLNAYFKGDTEVLGKYCSSHVIERCKAEHKAFEAQGTFFDYKILHISEVEVRETKMMGETPIIIVAFQTQQVYCVRDRLGKVIEGGQDTIHTVYYAWAMQLLDPEESGHSAPYSIWKLREMQQLGVRALI